MAVCSICLRPCGLAKDHPSCRDAVAVGQTPEQIRREIAGIERRRRSAALLESAKVLPGLAAVLFPVLAVACATWCVEAFGAKDSDFILICIAIGGLSGVLLAALLFNFFKMAAAVAVRLEGHLDRLEKES